MKKQLIIENAIELFSEQGVEATSIQQITDKCGISKGAFYLSFKSKDELIYSLIDQFITDITKEIEHLVNSNVESDQILRSYLEYQLGAFVKNLSFAKLIVKEHTFIFNKDLFARLQGYQQILIELTFTVVEKKYPHLAEHMKYDVVYFVIAITKTYTEMILFNTDNVNLELMCSSLEEKIDLIANNATIPFTDRPYVTCGKINRLNKKSIIEYFQNSLQKCDDPIVKESITLLLAHLNGETLSSAIEIGLLNNLKNNSETKHLVYLYNVSQHPTI